MNNQIGEIVSGILSIAAIITSSVALWVAVNGAQPSLEEPNVINLDEINRESTTYSMEDGDFEVDIVVVDGKLAVVKLCGPSAGYIRCINARTKRDIADLMRLTQRSKGVVEVFE